MKQQIEETDCQFCQDRLEEAAMSILEPQDRTRFEQHLAACPNCQRELTEIQATLRFLPLSCEQIDPGPAPLGAIKARIAEPIEPESKPLVSPQKPGAMRPPFSGFTSIAAAILAIVLIGGWSIMQISDDGTGIPTGNIQLYAMESNCPDCDENTGGQIGADPEASDGMVIAWNLDPNVKHHIWCVNRQGVKILVGELEVAESGSVMQTVKFPEAVGAYDQIYVARHDGTEELTVTPGRETPDEPSTTQEPTAAD